MEINQGKEVRSIYGASILFIIINEGWNKVGIFVVEPEGESTNFEWIKDKGVLMSML